MAEEEDWDLELANQFDAEWDCDDDEELEHVRIFCQPLSSVNQVCIAATRLTWSPGQ